MNYLDDVSRRLQSKPASHVAQLRHDRILGLAEDGGNLASHIALGEDLGDLFLLREERRVNPRVAHDVLHLARLAQWAGNPLQVYLALIYIVGQRVIGTEVAPDKPLSDEEQVIELVRAALDMRLVEVTVGIWIDMLYQVGHELDEIDLTHVISLHLTFRSIKIDLPLRGLEKLYFFLHSSSFMTVCTTKLSLGLNLDLPVSLFCNVE